MFSILLTFHACMLCWGKSKCLFYCVVRRVAAGRRRGPRFSRSSLGDQSIPLVNKPPQIHIYVYICIYIYIYIHTYIHIYHPKETVFSAGRKTQYDLDMGTQFPPINQGRGLQCLLLLSV